MTTGEYNIIEDFKEFNDSIIPVEVNRELTPKQLQENIIEMSPLLGTLIKTYNKLGYIPEEVSPLIKDIIDYHNTSLKGKDRRDGAYNFVSIRTKDISKSPINQIQAQAAIDDQTDKIKELLKQPKFQRLLAASTKADRGSVFSKFFMLTLTLAGKENVGIVASSLKNFEGLSQYIYQVLDEGSTEDQEDLLFDKSINGHRIQMIANSYTRNMDNIKSDRVRQALLEVDNDNDAFLVKSALLSLATDNAKDPVLAKLNSGPEMMSLFNSGVILGLSVEEVANLTLSDTGILLSNLTKSNVFNGQKGFNRLTSAIQYLQRPPSVYFTESQYKDISPLFQRLGILQPEEILSKTKLDSLLKNKNLREQLRRIFKFLSNPNSESSLLKFNKEQFIKDQIALLKGTHEYRGFSKRREELLNSLLEKQANLNTDESLTEEELSTINKLNELKVNKAVVDEQIQDLYNYLRDGTSPKNLEILDILAQTEKIASGDFEQEIKKLRSNFYGNSYFLSNMNELVNWIDYQNVVDNDIKEGYDGEKHKVLTQIAKLDEFSQEMSALRPLLALNQGIPNKMEDQFNFLTNFGSIITNRINTIGQENVSKFYNVQDQLTRLSELNQQLYEQGLISVDVEKTPYYIDLNTFVSNPEYNQLVKDIYGKIKFAVNILKVVDGVSHYHSYLRTANLAIQMGKNSSTAYRTALEINDRIVPKMNTNQSKIKEQIRKNILPTIYRKINQEYLRSKNIKYNIPQFEVKDGKIIMGEGTQTITLGYDKDNQKFKDWMQYIVFPKLQSENPGNKFIQYIGYRSYDYNSDHNQSINIAKIKQVNTKNPSDLVQFDLAKNDLLKLSSSDIDKLFYYNIIAYNNQAGQLSLTDLFEDLVSADNFESIRQYNEFWANHEDVPVQFNSDNELQIAIAPVLTVYELKPSLKIPYIYVRNRENGKTYLLYKIQKDSQQESEDNEVDYDVNEDNGFDEEIQGQNPKSFSEIIEHAGYGYFGQALTESQSEPTENSTEMLEFGEYKMTNESKVNDIKVQYKGKQYSSKEILDLAKSKGFATKLSEIFVKQTKDKQKVYNLEIIQSALDTIFNDENNCQ